MIPKRTQFHQSPEEWIFDNTFQIHVNWEERINTNKDRICKILGCQEFTQKWQLRQLMQLFDKSLSKTTKLLSLNPRLAVPQGFVDTKKCQYRMELLIPLNIEYPKFSNKFHTFALAISRSKSKNKIYAAKSILSLDMAYANARLVSYVESSWLLPQFRKQKKNQNNDYQPPPQITCSYDTL